MKKDLHPEYHVIDVKMVDGSVVQMKSTWGKEGDQMSLDIDPSVHPAWTGGNSSAATIGNAVLRGGVSRFRRRDAPIRAVFAIPVDFHWPTDSLILGIHGFCP